MWRGGFLHHLIDSIDCHLLNSADRIWDVPLIYRHTSSSVHHVLWNVSYATVLHDDVWRSSWGRSVWDVLLRLVYSLVCGQLPLEVGLGWRDLLCPLTGCLVSHCFLPLGVRRQDFLGSLAWHFVVIYDLCIVFGISFVALFPSLLHQSGLLLRLNFYRDAVFEIDWVYFVIASYRRVKAGNVIVTVHVDMDRLLPQVWHHLDDHSLILRGEAALGPHSHLNFRVWCTIRIALSYTSYRWMLILL